MANDLIISDSEFVLAEKTLLSYIKSINEISTEYVRIIGELVSNIDSPEIETQLDALSSAMQLCAESSGTLSEEMSGKAHDFIMAVDEEDQFIY